MKVIPVGSPADIKVAAGPDMKARAVAAFKAAEAAPQASSHSAQLDQNNISPEDMSAITPTLVDKTTSDEETVQAQTDSEIHTEETPKVEKPQQDPALSRQFAQLAKQEKALRAKAQQQEQQYKVREADLKAKEAALSAKPQVDTNDYISKAQLKQETITKLIEAGVPLDQFYEELTQQMLNQQQLDPRLKATINKLEAKIQQLEEQSENSQKSYADNQAAAYKSAVKQIEQDAKALVKHDPNFETIRATNSVRDVVDLITQTYDKDGVLLTVEEAAQEVENYLTEEAMKLTRIGKIKSRLAQVNASQAKTTQKTQASPKQTQSTMKTLTNAASSSRPLTARERAMLAFKGELKS